ncbi:NAD(P)H-hydrate dehydratase [Hyphobacterium sp. CCMP332]|nr:NAD(P)H-hydrate dehydratase [Hyphobacterium sp. CCMP332]
MKILSALQIQKLDQFTIENEPIASIDLMERASSTFADWYKQNFDQEQIVRILCGPGNNGGDGLAIARLLSQKGYKIEVDLVNPKNKFSQDAEVNLKRLPDKIPVRHIREVKDIPLNYSSEIIIDALFGSGLDRPLQGIYADIVRVVNKWDADIISIDIPSGLYCDKINSDENKIKAKYTLSFQLPKLSFFLKENEDCIGEWTILDIGLSKEGLDKLKTDIYYSTHSDIKAIVNKRRKKFDHKGNFGHTLIIAGSKGKMGAAVLASKSALRTGCGLLTAYIPEVGYNIFQSALPEAMCITDIGESFLIDIPDLQPFNSIAIGPGIGRNEETLTCLETLFERYSKPLVLDADALNLLAKNEHLLKAIPENSILTPHPGEFRRLAGAWEDEIEKLTLQKVFSKTYKCIIVLKGAYTTISDANGNIYINSTGNPGMATAGSGDVLTGMIAAQLSKGMDALNATKSAVYLHGLSGDLALLKIHEESMIAGDIIDHISMAYQRLD